MTKNLFFRALAIAAVLLLADNYSANAQNQRHSHREVRPVKEKRMAPSESRGDVTVTIMQSQTLAQIETLIQDAIDGCGYGDNVTVLGSKTGVNDDGLSLVIPYGITVVWEAELIATNNVIANAVRHCGPDPQQSRQ